MGFSPGPPPVDRDFDRFLPRRPCSSVGRARRRRGRTEAGDVLLRDPTDNSTVRVWSDHLKSRPAASLCFGALFALLAVSCTEGQPSDRAVLGRVGNGPPAGIPRGHHVVDRELGRSTRAAVRILPGRPLEVDAPDGSDELLWSAGLPRGHGRARTLVDVEVEVAAAWRSIASMELIAGRFWSDTKSSLPAGTQRIRFSIREDQGPADPAGVWVGGIVFTGPVSGATQRPHIVLISLDTLAASAISSLGGPEGLTPELDAILADSASFEMAFAQAGRTLPSHAAIFSGRYPHRSGITAMASGKNLQSLVGPLAETGYLTLAATENGYVGSRFGFAEGFDQFDDGFEGLQAGDAARTFEQARGLFERYQSTAPLFVFVHTYEVHTPYLLRSGEAERWLRQRSSADNRSYDAFAEKRRERGPGDPPLRWPPDDVRRLELLYQHGVHHLDRLIAQFVRDLEVLDARRNILIVLTSDHGEEFAPENVGHGGVDNDVLRIPLAFRWPGRIPARRHSGIVESIDIMPTIFELTGIDLAENLDGSSLAPRLLGLETMPSRKDFAFSFADRPVPNCRKPPCPKEFQYTAQSAGFKIVRNFDGSYAFRRLESGAQEGEDASVSHPQQMLEHRDWLESTLRERDSVPEAAENEIDAATQRRLEALGYIE